MFSLAGAQPKMALRYDGTTWSLPDGSEPTTHILKPAVPGLLDHDINEHLCLAAAAGAKILAARSQVMRFGAQRAIVVSRYDRRLGSDGRVTRVHQEDLCQALGVHPDNKYQRDGGPGVEAVPGLLRRLDVVLRAEQKGVEESPDLVHGELDQPVSCGCVLAFDRGGHGEERVGEHGQGGPRQQHLP